MKSFFLAEGIDWSALGTVAALMLGISAVFGLLILLTGKFFVIEKDSKLEGILKRLPRANCGGCGHPGCEGFAKALIEGKASVDDCNSIQKEQRTEIAGILGQASDGGGETVAAVACKGGGNCGDKFSYQGYAACAAEASVNGGRKSCVYGCVGGGSCVKVCNSQAVKVFNGVAEVDKRHCSSCGLCLAACPKSLIKRIPKSAKVFVACSCAGKGREVADACKKGCTACGLCEKHCPTGAMRIVNNIPVINYAECDGCKICAVKCPRKVIEETE